MYTKVGLFRMCQCSDQKINIFFYNKHIDICIYNIIYTCIYISIDIISPDDVLYYMLYISFDGFHTGFFRYS